MAWAASFLKATIYLEKNEVMLSQIKPLNQEERQNAQVAAQKAVMRAVGERPLREAFDRHTASRYPPSVTKLINGLCIVLLLAAFTPSAIRLFVIGSETFGAAVPDNLAMVAVGVATVLTAEIGQVVFSLALATEEQRQQAQTILDAHVPEDYRDRRQKAYLERGVTVEAMIVALWERVVEGRPEASDALQSLRESIKAEFPADR